MNKIIPFKFVKKIAHFCIFSIKLTVTHGIVREKEMKKHACKMDYMSYEESEFRWHGRINRETKLSAHNWYLMI
jgi:hypothetical protein